MTSPLFHLCVKAIFQCCIFFTYVYVRMLSTRQCTSLRVLSTPYIYVGRKNAALENNPRCQSENLSTNPLQYMACMVILTIQLEESLQQLPWHRVMLLVCHITNILVQNASQLGDRQCHPIVESTRCITI